MKRGGEGGYIERGGEGWYVEQERGRRMMVCGTRKGELNDGMWNKERGGE